MLNKSRILILMYRENFGSLKSPYFTKYTLKSTNKKVFYIFESTIFNLEYTTHHFSIDD